MRKITILLILTIGLAAHLLTGCVEENVSDNASLGLTFSTDTVMFDTLLSEQSSATRRFMIYNRNKRALSISSIYLGGGSSSDFRFNVDGRISGSGEAIKDIVIKAKDSLFVFVDVTPPKSSKNPDLLISDSLIITCNNNISSIKLFAVGHDAIILNNYALHDNATLDSLRPYHVFGPLYVPQGAKLTLKEGTELYMHGGSHIIVDGTLESKGTFEAPVIIRGDRFDRINDVDHTPYDQTSGQWGNIELRNTHSSYVFENTQIRGSSGGIILYGGFRSSPKLLFRNSVIHNSSAYGIFSQMGDVTIENSELSNCGESCLSLLGGNLKAAHVTFANYYRFGSRKNRSVRIMNYVVRNGQIVTFPVYSAVIENSIIFGDSNEELELAADTANNTDFNVILAYNLIKGKEIDNLYFQNCRWSKSRNIKNAKDTVFVNTSVEDIKKTGYFNFRLDSLSYARDCATSAVSSLYPVDLDGRSRNADGKPDLGAYERIDK